MQPASADAPAASPQMTPNDTLYGSQWHFPLIGDVEAVWEDYSGAGVEVAVYDDGVETAHPDLNYDPQNRQFEIIRPLPISPEAGHGTAVSGLIAATGNNNLGVIGGAHEAIVTGVNFLDVIQYDGSRCDAGFVRVGRQLRPHEQQLGPDTERYGSYQNILNDSAARKTRFLRLSRPPVVTALVRSLYRPQATMTSMPMGIQPTARASRHRSQQRQAPGTQRATPTGARAFWSPPLPVLSPPTSLVLAATRRAATTPRALAAPQRPHR